MKQTYLRAVQRALRRPFVGACLLLLGLGLFLAIALVHAPHASLWFDEGFSAYIRQFSFYDIARYTAADIHPPLYYWLLKLWTEWWGTSDTALRSLSVAFGAIAYVLSVLLARRLFGRQVAVVTGALLMVSPALIRYSDEARMYTLAAALAVGATLVLVKAMTTKRATQWWVFYGVLISLGMWTHYFVALVWLAHWAWRLYHVRAAGARGKLAWKQFFSKQWLLSYGLAIMLYLPWLFVMLGQLGKVQSSGFWIRQVGIDTPVNYVTNFFFYLENYDTKEWRAFWIILVVVGLTYLVPRAYRSLKKIEKGWFWLIASVAVVPPVLLFLASLPPLRSSFMDRYLVPSAVVAVIGLAVVLVAGTRGWQPWLRVLPVAVIMAMFIHGVTNVYSYGNFNKTTKTSIPARQVIETIQAVSPSSTPIIANSPWMFYEVATYDTPEHRIYFLGEATTYNFGSLLMLKESTTDKITQLKAFSATHPQVWYVGQLKNGVVTPYRNDWQLLKTVRVKDPITNRYSYGASLYQIAPRQLGERDEQEQHGYTGTIWHY